MEKEQLIKVHDSSGRFLSRCTVKRAEQLVARQKALWRDPASLILLITKREQKIIREEVRTRDNSTCYICGDHLTEEQITYDHIIPRSQNGTDYADNLAVCCNYCNEDKADRSYEEYVFYLYASILKF